MEIDMQFDLVQCTVRLMQKGNRDLTTIVKSGPDAITPPEVVLLRLEHDLPGFDEEGCAIGDAVTVGSVEMSKGDLYEMLMRKGFKPKQIEAAFPAGRGIPSTLMQADLPQSSLGKPLRKAEPAEPAPSPKAVASRKAEIRDALKKAGVTLPNANLSEADLLAIAEENGIALTEGA
jgi:hypothetical protein